MTHRVKIRPIFGDVDAMNVVYYGNYLRFFEKGRCEFMRTSGRTYAELTARGVQLPAVEAHLRYLRPARYDDPLVVETRLSWVKKASLRFDYRILKENSDGNQEVLTTGYTVHGCVNSEGQVRPLPDWMVNLLKTVSKYQEAPEEEG